LLLPALALLLPVSLLLPALAPLLAEPPLTAFVMPALTLEIAARTGLFAMVCLPDVVPPLTGTAAPPVVVTAASVAAVTLPVVPGGTVLGAVTGTCSFGRPTSLVEIDAFSAVAVAVAVGVAVAVSGDRRVDRELGQQG
jgi:hypothetical protein